jgi:flagellar biosynthesis/type III secretory pathway chaperone
MATNRDLLKEAIADAKAVKEMAIANAKAALEEAFTPQLKSMLSAKLQEMEEEIDEQEIEENIYEEEEEMMDEDLDLNELLDELNEEDEMESEEDEMESEEGEPLDLEDMTDEDLKKLIEDVIADMIEAGEIEAGEGEGEEAEEMESEEVEDEEVDLDELLAEIADFNDDMMEDDMMEYDMMEDDMNEEELEEIFGLGKKSKEPKRNFETVIKQLLADNESEVKQIAAETDPAKKKSLADPLLKKAFAEFKKLKADGVDADVIGNMSEFKRELFGDSRSLLQKLAAGSKGSVSIAREGIEEELEEALKTIETLRADLNEVNLLNAKLLYTNKIFNSAKNLTESQKLNILTSFDKAATVKETKLVFETLSEGLKTKKSPIKESLGMASKIVGTTNTKQPIIESDNMVARFQKLAGII